MKTWSVSVAVAVLVPLSVGARAVCSTPELSQVVQSAIGEACPTLARIGSDPHSVEVTPSMINSIRKSDKLYSIGLTLEDAWLKKAIEVSGTSIKWQGPNHTEVGPELDPISGGGHAHHDKNPHVLLSPKRVAHLFQKLSGGKTSELASKIPMWAERLKSTPKKVASYHGAYDYFLNDFGIASALTIEDEKKGAPGMKRLLEIQKQIKAQDIKLILLEPTAPSRVAEKLQEMNPQVKILKLPIGLTPELKDLNQLFELYISQLRM